MTTERPIRPRGKGGARARVKPLAVTSTLVVVAVLVTALVTALVLVFDGGVSSGGASVSFHGIPGVGYSLAGLQYGQDLSYSISGNATKVLDPGTTSPIDLVLGNVNSQSITVRSGAITISLTSSRPGCPVYPNFRVVQTLEQTVTVPAHRTTSLSQLGIPQKYWPIIAMVTTRTTQDVCEGMTFAIHYHGSDTRG